MSRADRNPWLAKMDITEILLKVALNTITPLTKDALVGLTKFYPTRIPVMYGTGISIIDNRNALYIHIRSFSILTLVLNLFDEILLCHKMYYIK